MRYEVREIEYTGNFRIWDIDGGKWIYNYGGKVFETPSLTGALWVTKTLNKEK